MSCHVSCNVSYAFRFYAIGGSPTKEGAQPVRMNQR